MRMLKKLIEISIVLSFLFKAAFAADMGIELHKAELSLKYGFKYIQDKDLVIDS